MKHCVELDKIASEKGFRFSRKIGPVWRMDLCFYCYGSPPEGVSMFEPKCGKYSFEVCDVCLKEESVGDLQDWIVRMHKEGMV